MDEQAEKANRLKRARGLANLSKIALSELAGISLASLESWEKGRYGGLSKKGALAITEAFKKIDVHCSVDWLLMGKDEPPILFSKNHDHKKQFMGYQKKLLSILWGDILFLHMCDDGLSPAYNKNDFVAGKKYSVSEAKKFFNQPCIVELTSGEILSRIIQPGKENSVFNLVCSNLNTQLETPFLYNVSIISFAPICWHYSPA